ncbi:bifunctional 3-demethylubiquinone-9 3-methyltransferase/ 2-octaprenyl-6-hydroxy phenol methylase [Campylobacter hyointestinalis subsp. hyointestinalis]|uniref:Bifunctional 3-demethylubiquinone-9 3-methyltransferase/ 2-octaprenyl-6-hydroxy phenol methylase n=1 Tax=Campylobacter hyointestinalis subsp. hyointestinalis TaxID=91352 RepID=A0A9W5ES16_CAMHY|nr:class I SAM-dependent methyltransferase [Campylobacter hyointestinalis]CUU71595.1 bifunctional 3-demethylubiquinone-9 3-methyltransferase/ 2-octaprenyl-6-hydroxy phenol methylase [Campylobacter hyointestinalis subsp. hyointestinalis]
MNENVKQTQENAYKLWEEHVSTGYLLYPNEYLTRYIFANRKSFKTVLDFGCGDGRHLEMMSKAKIPNIIGVDYNKSVLQIAKNRCNENGIKCEVFQSGEVLNLNEILGGEKVDCVVCWGITHLNSKETTSNFIKQFASVLNEGGSVFANWRTRKDSLYKKGEEIDKDTFIIDEESHKGMLYYFPSLDEIENIYDSAGLKITSKDYEEFSTNDGKIINSWHIIEAKKLKEI